MDCDVVVVGSGPNGLAGAVLAARAGLSVTVLEAQPTFGGGARTQALGLVPGVVHDLCSAIQPMALASPFFRAFDLAARGVDLVVPEVSYAQPLDGGRAGIAYRDLARTAEGLGADGSAWRALLGPLAARPDAVVALALDDHRGIPHGFDPRTAARFAARLVAQGTRAWNTGFSGDVAPALLTGVAAHGITTLPSLAAAGTALLLGSLAHAGGWPVPAGGSQAITDALVADLRAHGATLVADRPVADWRELPRARGYLFDVTPRGLVRILGDRLPARTRRALGRFRHGNAAAKVDFVLSGPVPWTVSEVGRAGTVHLGGTRAQMARAEAEVAAGRHAERPVVLVSDPTVADPGRLVATGTGALRPLWAYAHVPSGSTRDVTEVVTAQLERFAPGFRDLVVASRCVPAARMSRHDANYPGGDIAAGAVTTWQMLARPTPARDPYRLPVPGVYLCSASTPPGPGVHGMSGVHAARRLLAERFGIHRTPALGPGA